MKNLDKLIFYRFNLNNKKKIIIDNHPILLKKHCKELSRIISKEILINKKLIDTIFKQKESPDYFIYHEPIITLLVEINKELNSEKEFLKENQNKQDFLKLERKEDFLNTQLFKKIKSFHKLHHLDPSEYEKDINLLKQIQKEAHKISKNFSDSKYVRKHSLKIIELSEKAKDTSLYGYVQQDVSWIKNKAELMIKNPKDNKLGYAFATFYIVSPGTFELTGILLFFRYLGKYSIDTTKKIKSRKKSPT